MSTTYRLDIKGQFNLGNPWAGFCNSGEPIEVTRDSVPAIEEPSNYQTFCNDVDEALQKLVLVKKLHKCSAYLLSLIIISSIIPQLVIRIIISRDGPIMPFVIGFIGLVMISVVGLCVIYCKIYASMRGIYNDVKQICEQYSMPDGINYLVKDEWWGGCSKAHVRRYYLIVTVPGGGGGGGYDGEQQQPIGSNGGNMITAQTDVPTQPPDSFQPNPPETAPSAPTTTNNNIGGTTSLFDQLSGGSKY
eukprot:CAMPEP_0203684756 /NCGR_PEP_ID=MMETSP0090-20130426/48200_1 /ASSEMBLY_ACC=CAM_ASM_001088 /TAXON_ID=426623 /ORGANISM="Chaetoceros affinis, Strain CCMP159" /LENGTH=246 /DNA_ID=CAMNT_0050553937 /DNA_START=371 /DNA_END=1111 /DNA_ORIENTATION=-